jgi:hypothetical protein
MFNAATSNSMFPALLQNMVQTDDTPSCLIVPLRLLWPWWAPGSTYRLEQALSQLRSLSITDLHTPDVPGLLGTLAATCTQLTHLELDSRSQWELDCVVLQDFQRALDQLSSPHAFPALQRLSIGNWKMVYTSSKVCWLLLATMKGSTGAHRAVQVGQGRCSVQLAKMYSMPL